MPPLEKTKEKDPDATVDFLWDWSSWLDGDTIASYVFLVPDDLTETSQSSTTTTVTGWFSGGIAGQQYQVVNRITTTEGRINDWTMYLKVKER